VRVDVARFRPNRSQRRVRKHNEGLIELRRGTPSVNRAKLALYDRYHAYQSDARGWPQHPAKDVASYASSFVENPFPIEEWCYFLKGRLVGVGYVDHLPAVPDPSGRRPLALAGQEPLAGGLSAIYFFYDPRDRALSLGIWNVLSLIEEAGRQGLPCVYLGYYVAGCQSMEYKVHFVPNQLRGPDGSWRDFRQ
jgi:arginine-tRNA-protein transferase